MRFSKVTEPLVLGLKSFFYRRLGCRTEFGFRDFWIRAPLCALLAVGYWSYKDPYWWVMTFSSAVAAWRWSVRYEHAFCGEFKCPRCGKRLCRSAAAASGRNLHGVPVCQRCDERDGGMGAAVDRILDRIEDLKAFSRDQPSTQAGSASSSLPAGAEMAVFHEGAGTKKRELPKSLHFRPPPI